MKRNDSVTIIVKEGRNIDKDFCEYVVLIRLGFTGNHMVQ